MLHTASGFKRSFQLVLNSLYDNTPSNGERVFLLIFFLFETFQFSVCLRETIGLPIRAMNGIELC